MHHRIKAIAVALLLTTLLLSGCAPAPAHEQSDTGAPSSTADSTLMPSVTRMSQADAQAAVLAVAPNAEIETTPRKDAGPEGLVLEQDPPIGEPITGKVTLIVSAGSVAVPDVTGMTFGDAKSALETAGFDVVENSVADPTAADGTVIGQDPSPGARNAAGVTLDVVRKDAAIYLTDLKPVESDGSYEPGAAEVNGVKYAHAITFKPYTGDQASISFNLGNRFQRFDAVIGISDVAPADAQAIIEIRADDRQIFVTPGDVGLGAPVEIKNLDVTNVLRLTIIVTESGKGKGSFRPIVLGDPRLTAAR